MGSRASGARPGRSETGECSAAAPGDYGAARWTVSKAVCYCGVEARMTGPGKEAMFEYYDQRAPEYELIYTEGGGPASISDPSAYRREANALGGLVMDQVGRSHVDLACGTGYWLSYYHDRCDAITLVDQSRNMLSECRKKVERLGLSGKAILIRGNVVEHFLPASAYDSALIGFLLSHLAADAEASLFHTLRRILRPNGHFIILDSAWNAERAATRTKNGSQTRILSDGRTFAIPKRYFEPEDLLGMAGKYDADIRVAHLGKVFIAACGSFEA